MSTLDGTSVGTGKLAGNIFANTNNGNVWEINLQSGIQTLIATSGSRGDFVTADPNGTLLLTQTDRIMRLIAPPGGGFGNVPEPGTLTLLGACALAFLFVARLKRRSQP